MKKLIFLMGISFFAVSPFFVYAQLLDPVSYSVVDAPDTVKAGDIFEITVQASIEENWHLYSILNRPDLGPYPTQFSSGSTDLVIAGQINESDAEIEFDPNFDTDLGWHSNTAEFSIPIAFDHDLQGVQTLILEVFYQVCDDRSCLPPKTKEIRTEVIVSGISNTPYIIDQEGNLYSRWNERIVLLSTTLLLTLFALYYFLQKRKE